MLLEYNLKSTEIFVITHKPCKLIPKDNIYKMILIYFTELPNIIPPMISHNNYHN